MIDERDLTTRLTDEADQFFTKGGAPLEIGQVLGRAGEIRRGRRMRATMLMAACIVAVAVPTALLATRSHETPVQPAHRGNHVKVDSTPLTLQGLDRGAGPGTGYLAGTTWHTPANDGVDLSALDGRINEIAPLSTGYLVSVATGGGDVMAHYVDASARPGADEWLISGSLVVSDDRHVGAFALPDGRVVTVRDDGSSREFMRVPRGGSYDAVAMSGKCSGEPDDQRPCAVWVEGGGQKRTSWFVTDNAASTARTQYRKLADIRDDGGLAAGTTVVHDDLTTCSAVETTNSDEPGWTTCGHQMVAFSTDGKHVLAMPDGDGLGPTGLAVFDADKGTKLLDLSVADQGYVRQMIWEDNSHVLATIYQQGQWGIVRIGLDGSRQYAVPPVPAQDDVDPAVSLPIG